jgi:hypothetical protein
MGSADPLLAPLADSLDVHMMSCLGAWAHVASEKMFRKIFFKGFSCLETFLGFL